MIKRLHRLRWFAYAISIALLATVVLVDYRSTGAIRPGDIQRVDVKSDGSFFTAGTKMDLNGTESALVEAFRTNPKLAVAIRADTKEQYGDVMKVLSICQRNGIFKVGMSTKNE